jgi:hypothetical protein
MIVETDWPATGSCPGVTLSQNIPISVSGQTTWVSGIENVLNALPGGHGIGFVYWEPGWIGNAGLGSSCSVSIPSNGYWEPKNELVFHRTICLSMDRACLGPVCRCSRVESDRNARDMYVIPKAYIFTPTRISNCSAFF